MITETLTDNDLRDEMKVELLKKIKKIFRKHSKVNKELKSNIDKVEADISKLVNTWEEVLTEKSKKKLVKKIIQVLDQCDPTSMMNSMQGKLIEKRYPKDALRIYIANLCSVLTNLGYKPSPEKGLRGLLNEAYELIPNPF